MPKHNTDVAHHHLRTFCFLNRECAIPHLRTFCFLNRECAIPLTFPPSYGINPGIPSAQSLSRICPQRCSEVHGDL